MLRYKRYLIILVNICLLTIADAQAQAEPFQLFLDTSSDAVARVPIDVEVLALNENGEISQDFDGKKELLIDVEEGGMRDESYNVRSRKVRFKKGKASFSIEDSEEESLDINVAIAGTNLEGEISLSFMDKDIFPPEVVDIYEESPAVLKLEFNEEVEEESAQETRNYTAVTNNREKHPLRIEYHRTYVYLEFEEKFLKDEEGYIELEGVTDLNGNEISSGYKSPDFEGTCEDTCPED